MAMPQPVYSFRRPRLPEEEEAALLSAELPPLPEGVPGPEEFEPPELVAEETTEVPAREDTGEARRRALEMLASGQPYPSSVGDLAAAQQESRKLNLASGIGRTGAMINEAITGAKAPSDLYDKLDTQRPVREYMERLGVGERERKARRDAALSDPASAESRRYQAAIKSVLPGVFSDEQLSMLPAADAEEFLKYGSMTAQRGVQMQDQLRKASADKWRQEYDEQKLEAERQRIELEAQQLGLDRQLGWARLSLQEKLAMIEAELARERLARESAKDTRGPLLPASEAAAIGDIDAAIGMLADLGKKHDSMAGGIGGAIGAFIPASDAKKYDDAMLATAQAVGTILEGGKLAAGDEVKYRKMLPDVGDSPDRRAKKIENLNKLLEDKKRERLGAYGRAGYNVGGFSGTVPAPSALTPDGKGGYTLDDPPPPAPAPATPPRPAPSKKPAPALSAQDAQALKWARANPKDPRAAQIFKRLGVK